MKADEALQELGVSYNEIKQDRPTKGCEEAANARGLETSQIVKSLIVEAENEKYHVLLQGDRELSEKKLGKEYRMVPPRDAEEITGFEPGTVHPFSTELKHVVDQRIFENNKVSYTVGETTRAVLMDSDKFREALQESSFSVSIEDIVVSKDSDYSEIIEQGLDEEDAKFIVEKKYRKDFLELAERYNSNRLSKLFNAFHREQVDYSKKLAEKVLDRSENETHTQRLLEAYSKDGKLPEKNDFNLVEEVEGVLEDNSGAAEDFREGKDSAMNFLIGKLMERTNGKADAGEARQLIEENV